MSIKPTTEIRGPQGAEAVTPGNQNPDIHILLATPVGERDQTTSLSDFLPIALSAATDPNPTLPHKYKVVSGDGTLYAHLPSILAAVSSGALTNPGEVTIGDGVYAQVVNSNGLGDSSILLSAATKRLLDSGGMVTLSGVSVPLGYRTSTIYAYVEQAISSGNIVFRVSATPTVDAHIWFSYEV